MDLYNYLSISVSADTSPLDIFVAGTDEVYVIAPVERGWRFGRTTRRGTVTVTVADGRILSGARVLDLLRIAAACPGGGQELYDALAAAEIPTAPLRGPQWMFLTGTQAAETSGIAVRTFLAGRDIERMLSFPFQRATAHFGCTVLAPATAAMRPAAEEDAGIARISAPVERRYTVVYPDGVRPSARDIEAGDRLNLTYYAEGCVDAVHSVEAGRPSPFVEYDGAAIRVRPLSALGIRLDPVVSEPKPAPEAKPEQPKMNRMAPQQPATRSVTLVMRFDDDRTVRSQVAFDPESTEYRLLRSGIFHGYRARRLAVKAHGDESYLIDLRQEQPAAETPAPTPTVSPDDGHEADERRRRRRTSAWVWVMLTLVAIALGIVAVSYLPGLFASVDTYHTTPADTAVLPVNTLTLSDTVAGIPDTVTIIPDTAAAFADTAATITDTQSISQP